MTSEASPSARFVPVADVLLDHPAVHTQLGRDADDHHVVKDGQYISYTEKGRSPQICTVIMV